MNSGERLFWITFAVGMFMSTVLVKAGALHRFWPEHFAQPEACVQQAVAVQAVESLLRDSSLPEAVEGQAHV